MRILTQKRFLLALVVIAAYMVCGLSFGSDVEVVDTMTVAEETAHDDDSGHGGPVLGILISLVVILLAAKLGGDIFERFQQPAVLGELVLGMLIGNLHLIGIDLFESFKHDLTLEVLAELGVIILLFEVGLESSVREMMKVGLASFMVAVFGVITPFFLGWGVGYVFLPDASIYVHIFIGATLTATSVGITARVLQDIGKIKSREAKIILGAAVIDDILGLVILAVVAGIITAVGSGHGDGVSSGMILWIIIKAVLFVVGAIVIGSIILPTYFNLAIRLKVKGVFLSFCLLVCFALAFIAGKVGLAPIVGAFAAGLILDEIHYTRFREKGERDIKHLIEPISVFLVPIFFVRMGMMVDLTTFGRVEILGFAAVLTLAAIVSKQACSLAIFDRKTNRIAIGLGMIPRGEVGLIFAGIGAKLILDGQPIVSASIYSAIVIMVIITTLVTPPALKASLLRGAKNAPAPS
ncbi:MAG: cation:proton antiporter [candidate division Zixibacteria bacterium]|nr:cation:proton antiporter [candidate division Zixibacteria bacterium]